MNKKNIKTVTIIIVLIIVVGVGGISIGKMKNSASSYAEKVTSKLEEGPDYSDVLKKYGIEEKDSKEIKKEIKLEEDKKKRSLTSEEVKTIIDSKISNNDTKVNESSNKIEENNKKEAIDKKGNIDVKILVEDGVMKGTTAIVVELMGVEDSSKYEVKVDDTSLDYYEKRKKFGGFVQGALDEKQVSEKLQIKLK